MKIASNIQNTNEPESDNVLDSSCTKNDTETMEKRRDQLEKELLKRRPDHFVIIELCRSFTTSIPEELRAVIWKEILGVSRTERLYLDQSIARVEEDLANQKVIMADALRTRANDSDFFKKKETIDMIVKILTYYCKCRNIRYKQGMNEVLAPFFMLSKEPPLPEGIIFQCFYALIDKFLPHVFSDKEFKSLQCSFQLYRLLLLYHDPTLCHHLDQHDMTPELYVTPWFMTLFARNLPALIVFELWDLLILEGDPYMLHFVALALVQSRREEILTSDIAMIPQVLSTITFKSIEMVRTIFDQAKQLVKNTPRSFRKDLHAACYGGYTSAMLPYLRQLSFASCLGMYPNELVTNLMGRITTHNSEDDLTQKNNVTALSSGSSSSSGIFFIVLDCRPLEQYDECHLSLSYHIDPEIVSSPDALDVLMTGFSKMRGCHFIFLGPSETSRTKRLTAQSAAIHTLNKLTRGITTDKMGDTPLGTTNTTTTLSPQAQGMIMHEEHVYVTRLVLMFLQKGFEHVSTLYGGFDALKKEILTQNTFTQEQLLVQPDSAYGMESGSTKVLKSLAKTKELFGRVRSVSEEEAFRLKTKATVSNLSRTFQNLKMVAKDAVQHSSSISGSQAQQISTEEKQVVDEDEWVEVCVKTQQALEKSRKEEIVKEVVFEEGSMGILFQNAASHRRKKYAVLVDSLVPGGQAARSQQIEPGDSVVAVNGQNVADVSFASIIEMMKDSPRPFELSFQSFSMKKAIESLDLLSIPPVAPSLLTASHHSLCISWTRITIPNACYHLQYTKRSEYNYNPWKNVTMKNMLTGEIDSFGVTTDTNGTMVGLDPGTSFIFRVRCGNGDRWGPYSLSSGAMSTFEKGDDDMTDKSKNDTTNSNALPSSQAIFLPGECPEFFEKGTFYFKVLLGLRARSAPLFYAEKLDIVLEKDTIIKCTERLVVPGTNQIFVKLEDDITAWAFENTPEGAVVLQRLPDEEEANELLLLQEQRQQQESQNQIGQQAKTLMTNLLNASGIKQGGANTTNIIPPAAPMVFAISPTSLVVTWDPINDMNVTKYQIQFAKNRLTAMWHTVKDELNADTIKYVIEGLPPNTAYTVRIRGGSDDVWGPYSDTSAVCNTEVLDEKPTDDSTLARKKPGEPGNNELILIREPSFLEKAVAAASRMSKRAASVGEDQRNVPKDVDREELLREETESNAGVTFVDLEKWKTSKEPTFQDFHFFQAVKIFLDNEKEQITLGSTTTTFVRELVVTSDMLLVLDPTKSKSSKGFASIEDQRSLNSLIKITSKKTLDNSIVFHFKARATQTGSTKSIEREADQLIFIIDEKNSYDACLSVVMSHFKQLDVAS